MAIGRGPRADGGGEGWRGVFRLSGNSKLACAEGDDAADGVVGRHANGNPIPWHDLDPEPAHSPAELGKHLVSRIRLHPVQPAAVDSDDCALDIDQIVLTQTFSLPFKHVFG